MARMMKAVNLYAPGDLRVEQAPVPVPGEGEVLVKVKAVGVCGSDISRVMETGTYTFPTIPGHELGGEVAETGPGVDGSLVGGRVTVIPMMPCKVCDYCRIGEYQLCEKYNYLGSRTNGAYAEYVKAPAENLLPLPDSVSFEFGAMTDPIAVALHAVKKLGMQPGDRAGVFGVGPIGVFAVQWAKVLGAREVVAVDIFPEKLEVAADLGADHCIDSRREDPLEKVKELTDGKGLERTVEFAGNPVTQEQCILVTSKLGSSVWGGISHKGLPLGQQAVDDILRKELMIVGSWNSSFAPIVSDWEKALTYMGSGRIRAGDVITHRLPLEKMLDAFKMMLARQEYFNKVMFFPEQ